jgi:hypothetical protein
MSSASGSLTAMLQVAWANAHRSNCSNFSHCRFTYHRRTAFSSVSVYLFQMSDSTLCAITTHGTRRSFPRRPRRSTWA